MLLSTLEIPPLPRAMKTAAACPAPVACGELLLALIDFTPGDSCARVLSCGSCSASNDEIEGAVLRVNVGWETKHTQLRQAHPQTGAI